MQSNETKQTASQQTKPSKAMSSLGRRKSKRLANKNRQQEEAEELLSSSSSTSSSSTKARITYRPKASDSAILQDCGILPSE